MGRLNANTVVMRGYEAVSLAQGDEVPEWAADQVGEHLLEQQGYDTQSVADLKAEVERRNADREDDGKVVPASAKKADLVAALVADDEAQA